MNICVVFLRRLPITWELRGLKFNQMLRKIFLRYNRDQMKAKCRWCISIQAIILFQLYPKPSGSYKKSVLYTEGSLGVVVNYWNIDGKVKRNRFDHACTILQAWYFRRGAYSNCQRLKMKLRRVNLPNLSIYLWVVFFLHSIVSTVFQINEKIHQMKK